MSDLISRKALLTEIRKRCGMWKKTAEIFCEVIEKQPPVEAVPVVHGEWIPCSDILPDVEEDVLLSLRNLDVNTGFRANTEGCFYVKGEGYVKYDNVFAWMPLPEPYKTDMRKKV